MIILCVKYLCVEYHYFDNIQTFCMLHKYGRQKKIFLISLCKISHVVENVCLHILNILVLLFGWFGCLFCYFETEFLWLSLAGLELIP